MKIVEMEAKIPLNRIKDFLPYKWDLNVYRGCQHACVYCYALYSHRFLESENFFNQLYVKTNIVELLDKKLSSPRWHKEIINLGGVTDSYQAIEADYQLMPGIWKTLIKHNNPALICTKSHLLLRDIDLINQLSQKTYVSVAATITTVNERIKNIIEPGSPPFLERLKMLREVKQKTKAKTALMLMPVLPYLTDSENNLDVIFALAKKCPVDYVLVGLLNLIGDTKKHYFQFIEKEFPQLSSKYKALYKRGRIDAEYKKNFFQKVERIRKKYGLPSWTKPTSDNNA